MAIFKRQIWNRKDKSAFFQELYLLLENGMVLSQALSLVQLSNPQKNKLVKRLMQSLQSGQSFSAALEKENSFTAFELSMIQIGEQTGNLAQIVKELSDYHIRRTELRQQIVKALSYPILVLITACAAIVFMLFYVVPMFEQLFTRFGNDLPALTQTVLSISSFALKNWLFIIIAIALIVLFVLFLNSNKAFKKRAQYVSLKIPFLKNYIHAYQGGLLTNIMKILLGAQIDFKQSVQFTDKALAFQPFNDALKELETDLDKGVSISKSVNDSKQLGDRIIHLMKIGEETNSMSRCFEILAADFKTKLDHQTKLITSIMEPLIILVLGLIVGVILIAMYLPIFQMGLQF